MIDVDKPAAPPSSPATRPATGAAPKQGATLVADRDSDGHKKPAAQKPAGRS